MKISKPHIIGATVCLALLLLAGSGLAFVGVAATGIQEPVLDDRFK